MQARRTRPSVIEMKLQLMQDRQQWLTLLTGENGAHISHLVFLVNNSLSDDLIEARWADAHSNV